MRNKAMLGIWASTLIAGVAVPESAPATMRWKGDGSLCLTARHELDFTAYSSLGLQIPAEGAAHVATCAIPTGTDLYSLEDGSTHVIDEVSVRLRQEGPDDDVVMQLLVHDHNSTSVCSCGSDSKVIGGGEYSMFNVEFDCGSCSYDDDWAINLRIDSEAGSTLIKQISVYDRG